MSDILNAVTPAIVHALQTTPVKGLRVVAREAVELTSTGVAEDRRFYLVDDRNRMVNGKHLGTLNEVVGDYDHEARTLVLTFPDGSEVIGPVETGPQLDTRFYSRQAPAHELRGGFSDALSEHVGRPVRIVEGVDRSGIDRGKGGAVSLVSRASLDALARVAGAGDLDSRRFRMLVIVDGLGEPHEEDTWVGQDVNVGAARVRMRGHVGRCNITHRHPETGDPDLRTLDLLRQYRSALDTTEPLAFGVYGEVREPGRIAVGDAVELTPR
ncbi:MAG TPA: MOSC domain-containing protein [Solirubrobacteraceae bacterium]|nr:MOSC domain-containing protein [Solirubrobacteraceae bacterium]